jgi:hypothetical protein
MNAPCTHHLREECLVLSKAIAVALLSSIALAVSGCGGGSDAEAEGPVDITKLRAEVTERFGTPPNEAPWYRHITAISWANGRLEIATDLDDEPSEISRGMCGETWKLAFEQAKPGTFNSGVVVLDSSGIELGGCA